MQRNAISVEDMLRSMIDRRNTEKEVQLLPHKRVVTMPPATKLPVQIKQ